MNGKFGFLERFATLRGDMLREKLLRPKARSISYLPISGEAITVEWLTAVLCRDTPDAEVIAFHTSDGNNGASMPVAIRVVYNEAGERAGLPTALVAKTTTTSSQRMFFGGAKAIDGESHFYLNLRPEVEIEAPLGYWVVVDPLTRRSVALMEDIAVTRGAVFLEPTTPLSHDQIEDLVRNLARLHGTFWAHPSIAVLKTPNNMLNTVSSSIDIKGYCAVGLERVQEVVPTSLHDQHERLWAGVERALDLATTGMAPTVLHGDPHPGQTYMTGEGRMGLADWKVVMGGGWAQDFAYAVNTGCEPEDRRAWDRELLTVYLDELAPAGSTVPSFDDAWLAYRQQTIFAYAAWAFTLGRAEHQPEIPPVETCSALLRRITTALDDHDSLGALGL